MQGVLLSRLEIYEMSASRPVHAFFGDSAQALPRETSKSSMREEGLWKQLSKKGIMMYQTETPGGIDQEVVQPEGLAIG